MGTRATWVAQTGIFLALLIAAQIVTRPFGSSILTGSLNNMLFILTVMLCGLYSAMLLSVVSPIIAFVMGMAPFWPFIPVIIAGNLVLVILWHFIALRDDNSSKARKIIALVAAAVIKFLVLYIGIVHIVVPVILGLEGPQAIAVSAAFSWPQIITATIGGILALLLFPVLSRALKRR